MHQIPATSLLLIVALVSGLQGCVSTDAQGLQSTAPPNEAATVSKDMMTVENLLRWPLEGPAGADKAIAGLHQVFVLEKLQTPEFYGNGPVKLVDDHILTFTFFSPDFRSVGMGVGQEPCFPAERAAAVINALPSPITQDAHGIDRGKSYDARRNGMWVSFHTTPITYKCVTSIHVRTIRKPF